MIASLQALTQRLWSPASQWHIGDVAWQRNQHLDSSWPTALWHRDSHLVAWAWLYPTGDLALQVDPAYPTVADEVLTWGNGAPTTVLDGETHLIQALSDHGYHQVDTEYYSSYESRSLADLPEPTVPSGFTLRPVTAADVRARVAVHRAAWHPSRVTEASYRNVMAASPYRPTLDWVAVTPAGEFAANCLIWLDAHNRVAELEPVGTDPRYRRRGLARAVCLAAMHAAREAGAEQAIVYPVANHPNGALNLYRDLGFQPYARTFSYRMPFRQSQGA